VTAERPGLARLAPALWRSGFLDPTTLAPLVAATAWWGSTAAAPYAAAAARHPLRTALVDDHGSLNYLQLAMRTDGAAAALRTAGVRDRDTVAVLCRNHRGFVETTIALAKLGARPVFCNTGLSSSQLRPVLDREGVTLIVCDREFEELVAEARPGIERVVVAPEDDAGWSFPGLPRRRVLLRVPGPGSVSDPVILTSGTTGVPKGARRSGRATDLVSVAGLLDAIPLRRGGRTVIAAPLFHAWGLSQMMLAAALASTVVLRRRFDPARTLADAAEPTADAVVVVPTMLSRMLEVVDGPSLAGVGVVASSGGPLPGDLATRWMDTHGDHLHNMYGSTEVGPVSIAGPADLRLAPTTAGRPPLGVAVRIVDHEGRPVPVGRPGRILARSGSHFEGYTGGGSKPVIDGFMDIGDTGHLDHAGLLHVTGRVDDMIVSGGENLYPGPIEDVLVTHPAVVEAAVVGVADAALGQRVEAHLVVRGQAPGIEDLRAHCRASLAAHEVPRDFVFHEVLPRNATGKVLRTTLAAQ
jgi:acyl-CoA synthetase (AMP-forming)/AMP-acid ligase II